MWVFYMLVRLQRFIPLCPRRTLVPKKEMAPANEPVLEGVS
jgi:hypothetical protein